MPQTPEQKLISDIKKIIKATRAKEEIVRTEAPSRSTGIRNVYKNGHDALGEIETLIRERGKKW